jgi:alpha-L-fucosidase
MNKISVLPGIIFGLVALSLAAAAAAESGRWPFFPFCIDTHDSEKRSLQEQAAMLVELGYEGMGHLWLDNIEERLRTLDERNLKLFQITLKLSLNPDEAPYDPRLKEVLPLLKGRGVQLALIMGGMAPSDPQGDPRAVEIVREIATMAQPHGVELLLYPHITDWLERLQDCVRVCEQVAMPNVGVMFNLCHWLKVDGKDLEPLLRSAMPHLRAVSIHGADSVEEVQAGTGNWIQPLGRGTYDVPALLGLLRELGYTGPVGLQCWGIEGDTGAHLAESMAAWKGYTASASAGPLGLPTPEQVAWHEMELEMFLCLDPCTWQGREYDDHSTPLSEINPSQLDTDQWCEVAQSFGAKQIVFVAKHTGGFCWWQTDTSEYSIKNTPYKDGQGDILAELSESCAKYGLKLGVYIYPGDDQWGAGIGSGGKTEDPAKQEAYNQVLRQQWTEVLTGYGEVSEVWFDGSCVVEVGDILAKHAPKAMVFQGPHATLRWPGNEQGIAAYPTWQTVMRADAETGVSTGRHSDPDGDVWLPMEMDTPLLDHKWFWAPDTDRMLKPLSTLMEIYYASVGRGCVLLLNATPDVTGRIPESHVARYKAFGEAIARIYQNQIAETSGRGSLIEMTFPAPAMVDHVVTMEDIRYGHRIRAYDIEGLSGGEWRSLVKGISVGYKRIDVIDPVAVEGLRLRVTEAVGEPVIPQFAAYATQGKGVPTAMPEQAAVPEQAAGQGGPWETVAGWNGSALTKAWRAFDIELTSYIPQAGQYEVELNPAEGSPRLDVRNALVIMGSDEAPRLISPLDRKHAWNINRTDQVTPDAQGATYLRFEARTPGDEPWVGECRIRRMD